MAKESVQPVENTGGDGILPPALPPELARRLTPDQIQLFEASRLRAGAMTQTEVSKGFGPGPGKDKASS